MGGSAAALAHSLCARRRHAAAAWLCPRRNRRVATSAQLRIACVPAPFRALRAHCCAYATPPARKAPTCNQNIYIACRSKLVAIVQRRLLSVQPRLVWMRRERAQDGLQCTAGNARHLVRAGVQLRTRVLQRSEEQDLQAAGPCKRAGGPALGVGGWRRRR